MPMMFFWTLMACDSYWPKKEQSLAFMFCWAMASACLPALQSVTALHSDGA